MNFSPEWDDAFRANTHISIWPWSDLVSYVHRYAPPSDAFRRVLELGCGMGANIRFFRELDLDYSAIEGSVAAVTRLRDVHPDLRDKIVVGDFTQAIPFNRPFDLVVDRAAVTHNTTVAIARTLRLVHELLRPGGKFIGIDWFSTQHDQATSGVALDPNTRTKIPVRQFAGIGIVHFADEGHILDLFTNARFHIERLEHKKNEVRVPVGSGQAAAWNLVAVKS